MNPGAAERQATCARSESPSLVSEPSSEPPLPSWNRRPPDRRTPDGGYRERPVRATVAVVCVGERDAGEIALRRLAAGVQASA